MPTLQNFESAKIIQFPLQRRLGVDGRTGQKTTHEAERPFVSYDSWYHDEAVREERTHKQ